MFLFIILTTTDKIKLCIERYILLTTKGGEVVFVFYTVEQQHRLRCGGILMFTLLRISCVECSSEKIEKVSQ